MADPRGFLKVTERELPPNRPVEVRLRDWKDTHAHRAEGQPFLKEQAGRCMDCGVPFCHQGCPLGNLIPDWNDLVRRGQWADAIDRLHASGQRVFAAVGALHMPGPTGLPALLARRGYQVERVAFER